MTAPRKPVALYAYRRAGSDEPWRPCLDERHRDNTEADPLWEVAALYRAPNLQPLWALVEKWAARSRQAIPTDAMLINLQIRELREALEAMQ